jgi:hypothetical protein
MDERRRGGGGFFRPLQLIGLLGLLVYVLFAGQDSQARLDPYYVLRALGSGDVRPRILFVVDTSGSMSWRANQWNQQCDWDDCETQTDTRESRISAARRIINNVISKSGETASFALMTFDQHDPPTWTPSLCSGGRRFTWVTYYGYFVWSQLWTHPGINGTWRLCQGNEQRPYPYMRWDDLGVNSPIASNNQTGDIPPSPLIGSTPQHSNNAYRGVQWFPKFMGVRTQLNASTDPDRAILDRTYGDYGADSVNRNANVWGHDFYYWPYVDGFPQYAGYVLWPYDSGHNRGGVVGENSAVLEAKLYAPFYLDLSESGIPEADWGPEDADAAMDAVLAKTAPLIEGGVDAAGGTPWASVIGTATGTYPRANTEGSHRSVASYLNFVTEESGGGICAPTSAVLLTDGVPSPSSEGGPNLYRRLAALRNDLGIKTYVVGFFQSTGEINNMACAAAGGCDGFSCYSPCDDGAADDWDTCANPADPGGGCAYMANSSDELAEVLTSIVTAALKMELPSGPGATMNEFGVGEGGTPGAGEIVQTSIAASTAWPGWRGTVERSLCEHRDGDGELLAQCQLPSPQWQPDELETPFGPCPQSYAWEAGECLQQTDWDARVLYTARSDGSLIRINRDDGTAAADFRDLLQAEGVIAPPDLQSKADAIAAFIAGRDWLEDWKLPGLASSTPAVIRRIPRLRTTTVPSVAIRDPHCGGRRLSEADAGTLPRSLEDFARNAWAARLGDGSGHYEYQEAVLIGDDMGMLHAFQYNSGNEIWGFIPPDMLHTVAAQADLGATAAGQPEALDEHIYGISSTVNTAWVYDDSAADEADHQWRHLAVFGYGPGGHEYVALDVSHMSRLSSRAPLEVLWSTADDDHAATYDGLLGETWSRPAITYHVPGDDMENEPDPFLIVGSGYAPAGSTAGRHLLRIDALTGALVDSADIGAAPGTPWESVSGDGEFGLVSDIAVGTHCLSRFWAEAQEAYVADPAGRLFRWDLGRETDHEADSGGRWNGSATPAATFGSCTGTGQTCTVDTGIGEPFAFAPAVTANDRIDDPSAVASGSGPGGQDQFLVAMVSGSPSDSAINLADENRFHASLYLLVDDHRSDPEAGFNIPSGAPKTAVGDVGSHPAYLRLALSDITRTRTFVPYDGASEISETRAFHPRTRPIRAPRIMMRGVVDTTGETPQVVEGVEVAEITYFVYEPPTESCDPRFYDSDSGTWHHDEGATFRIAFRLTVDSTSGFNFQTGASEDAVDFADPGMQRGLTLVGIEQDRSAGACEDGNCGPQPSAEPNVACDNNDDSPPSSSTSYAIPISARQLQAFTPVEG